MSFLSVRLVCGEEFSLRVPEDLTDIDEFAFLLGVTPKPGVSAIPMASVSLSILENGDNLGVVQKTVGTDGVLVVEKQKQNSNNEPSRNLLYSSLRGRLQIHLQEDKHLELTAVPQAMSRPSFRMHLWHLTVVCGAMGAVLRGLPVVLMHGAVLMHGDSAVLLCGDSGIGKSTTSRRWESLGHAFAADDMFLLEYGPDGRFYAYALPTWSRCRVKPEAPRVPFDRPLPVAGVLGLSRDDDNDVIEDVSRVVFLGHVLRSMTFHTSILVTYLPQDDQRLFSARVAATAGRIAATFPPRRLAANLNGDLAAALGSYLASIRG